MGVESIDWNRGDDGLWLDADLEEVHETERPLLYVACIRARDHLLVTEVNPASEFLDDLVGSQSVWPLATIGGFRKIASVGRVQRPDRTAGGATLGNRPILSRRAAQIVKLLPMPPPVRSRSDNPVFSGSDRVLSR
jgi:hypothetical protein